jgi:hypothetical protein
MKLLITIFLWLPLFCFSQQKKPKNDLEGLNLKGRVKCFTLMESRKEQNSDKLIKDTLPQLKDTFNISGFIVESLTYSGDHLSEKEVNKYDKNNNLTERIYIEPYWSPTYVSAPGKDSMVVTKNKFTYKLDLKGNILELYVTSNSKPYIKENYKYNASGQRTEGKTYMPPDSLFTITTYTYDKSGNMIHYLLRHVNDSLINEFSCQYDSAGNIITQANRNFEDKSSYKVTCTYDSRGNPIRNIDETYDPKSDEHYEYSNFDPFGNWLCREFYFNGKPISKTERTIEYY